VGEITQSAWLGLLVACTILNAAASVLLARASLPMRIKKWAARCDTERDDLVATVADIQKRAKLWDSTLNGLIDEAQNAFERAERKRASVASTASKAAAAQGPDPSTMSRAQRIEYRRAQLAGR